MNTALTWQRRESRRHRVIDRAAPFIQLIESTAQPVDQVDRDAINDLYRAIRQLRPADRALILLHLDGLSYRNRAHPRNLANAVGSRLTRTRDSLAKSMKGNPHHEGI